MQGKDVFVITVGAYNPKDGQPAFLDKEKCYRRTGPRSDQVKTGPELVNFVVERQNRVSTDV